MTADLVQARHPFVGRLAGIRVLVRAGDLYHANDALVTAFPDKFRAPKVHATGDSVGPQPATQPAPEPKAGVVKEFSKLKLTDEADVPRVAEALAKLDEVTLAALYAEYEIEEDTPEAALLALAATRYSEPKASESVAKPVVSSKQTSKADTTQKSKAKAPAKRKAAPKRTAPKKASASKSK